MPLHGLREHRQVDPGCERAVTETAQETQVELEVGHLPSVDIVLAVGKGSQVVEVTAVAPVIDVTTNVTTTNVREGVIDNVPHGTSFQSVIQFAPAARNEPLMGNNAATAATSFNSAATGNGNGFGLNLGQAATLASWPTDTSCSEISI